MSLAFTEGEMMLEELIKSARQIDWAISLVAAIPLAVIANLITPNIGKMLSRKSKSMARKRAEMLKCELCEAKAAASNLNKVYLDSFILILMTLLFFVISSILIAIPGLQIITLPLVCLVFMSIIEYIWKHIKLLKRCRDIEKYEIEINDAIGRLISKSESIDESES